MFEVILLASPLIVFGGIVLKQVIDSFLYLPSKYL